MFSHVFLGTNDLDASGRFYDATLGTLGVASGSRDPRGTAIYWTTDAGLFGVTRPIDGQPACHANGGTIGFAASSPDQVDAWHAAGVAAGGRSCEDPPGIRDFGEFKLYLAYLRDPAGNKLCGMYRMP